MIPNIETYLAPALAAVVRMPYELAQDFCAQPESSREHFARAIANIATAAAKAEIALAEMHPSRAELIKKSIADILASCLIDARDFTLTSESMDLPRATGTVKANLAKLEDILRVQCSIVLRACELAEAKQTKEGGQHA
jgi:hypothetical protein